MPIRLNPPLIKDYLLEKTDHKFGVDPASGATKISVRQATQGDVETRNRLYMQVTREYSPGGSMKITQDISWDELAREEVFLTLTDCNIQNKDGQSLFQFDNGRLKDRKAFQAAWVLLDPFIADEIHDCVIDLNVMWAFPTVATEE